MTTTLGPDQRQDQDIGNCHQSGWVRFDPDDDTAPGERELIDFYNALFDLQEELAAMRQAQVDKTAELLASKPEANGCPLVDIIAAAEAAVALDERRVLAFQLPELVHETPDQLADAMVHDDEELKRRLEAALDLAAQAPPSFRRFRDETALALQRATHNQAAIASQQLTQRTTITARQNTRQQPAGTARPPRWVRRQLAQLDRGRQAVIQDGHDNQQRFQQLQARLAVIDAAEQARQEWVVEDPARAAVLALGVAAAEALLERRVAPRLARFWGSTDPEAPTEPFPLLVVLSASEER